MTPLDRSKKIKAILEQFYNDEAIADVTDILADLRHFCDHHEISLSDADRSAHQHYLAEKQEAQS